MKNSIHLFYFLIAALALLLIGACEKKETRNIAVYKVAKSGVTPESAEQLIKLLPIEENLLKDGRYIDNDGRISIFDSTRHLSVPIKTLGTEENNEDGQTVIAEALDMEALKSVKTMPPVDAQERFLDALQKSSLLPAEGEARTRNNFLNIVDNEGEIISNTAINTRVSFDVRVGDIPVEGPGAKINVSFLGDESVSRLKYANRNISEGEMVRLLDPEKIKERCKRMYGRSAPEKKYQEIEVATRLFYYSPPLSKEGVHTLIPYYECSGTAVYENQRISLLQHLIPATDDKKYVPKISLKTTLNNNEVEATAEIEGGSSPYQIRWSSPSIGAREGSNELKYTLSRRSSEVEEILLLEVTDNNGVFVQASQVIEFDPSVLPQLFNLSYDCPEVDWRAYGTENSVYNEFGSLEQGFKDQMDADGVPRVFSWRGLAAWEQDFKAPGDNKCTGIDSTDITFYVGHGNVGYFTFEDYTHEDSRLDNNDATGDWGDLDLEWLALYSCKVMGKGSDGQEPFRNWKQEFDGLHLLLGFHTNAQVSNQFSGKFASNMLSSKMTVLNAWFDAIDDHQPNDREGVVMGVFRSSDGVWNYSDHFWGKGSVGPDIRGSNIGLGWYVTGP